MATLDCQCSHPDYEHLLLRTECLVKGCTCIKFKEQKKKKEAKKK